VREKENMMTTKNMVQNAEGVRINQGVLFWAGILGPFVYVLNVILGGVITQGYSHIRNAVSELTQRGASNIVTFSAFFVVSAILMIVFGIAIMLHYRHQSRQVYAGGALIVVYGVFAALLATVFPQDPVGAESTIPGTMHLVFAGLAALVIVGSILLIGMGLRQTEERWHYFKLYSVITVIVMLIFGASTPILMMNGIELMGLFERLTQLAYLQWFVILAVKSSAVNAR
jgi:hypothetical membrane protein